jgi:hypothetical protein
LIRLFHVYYPIRTLILLLGEALIVWTSFLLAAWWSSGRQLPGAELMRAATSRSSESPPLVLLCSHWFDLYDTARLNTKGELYFRLLMVPGLYWRS